MLHRCKHSLAPLPSAAVRDAGSPLILTLAHITAQHRFPWDHDDISRPQTGKAAFIDLLIDPLIGKAQHPSSFLNRNVSWQIGTACILAHADTLELPCSS